jgi:hypothetical protein
MRLVSFLRPSHPIVIAILLPPPLTPPARNSKWYHHQWWYHPPMVVPTVNGNTVRSFYYARTTARSERKLDHCLTL